MAEDQIRYDVLVKDALRSVIKKVLADVAKNGLPENHHFFITFLTEHPGVKISSRLKKLYPQQMTIVLQHQFWGLHVWENFFEVSLSFSNIPEKLIIPFNAIQIFLDPVAAFETTFDLPADASNNNNKEPFETSFFKTRIIQNPLRKLDLKKLEFQNNFIKDSRKKEKNKVIDPDFKNTPPAKKEEKAKAKTGETLPPKGSNSFMPTLTVTIEPEKTNPKSLEKKPKNEKTKKEQTITSKKSGAEVVSLEAFRKNKD